MLILIKFDIKLKLLKVYFIDQKNKKTINAIFDKL